MYMSGSKKQTKDPWLDSWPKRDQNLYGRPTILTRSNRDIDQKNAVVNYEFTLTPRALFAPDGSMLPRTDKCTGNIINVCRDCWWNSSFPEDDNEKTLSTVKDLGQGLNDRLTSLTAEFSEVILVFDTYMYKPDSLKNRTRERGCMTRKSSYTVQNCRWYIQTSNTSRSHGFYHLKKQ